MIYKERKCRVCGCTWHQACPGGCSWVEIDLCSACVGKKVERVEGMTPDEAYQMISSKLAAIDGKYPQGIEGPWPFDIEAIRALLEEHQAAHNRPEIVCLCGSTRFYDAFQHANYELTMQGVIVLTVGFYPHSQEQAHGQTIGCTTEQKAALDKLRKRKIDLADSILVISVGGYIGESARSEILYAKAKGKPVRFWDSTESLTWRGPGTGGEGRP